MSATTVRGLLLGLLLAASPALAQTEGRYDVTGTDAALGPYTGEVELRNKGSHFEYVRKVRYQNPQANRPLTTVWIGVVSPQGYVSVPLNRMDWVTQVRAGGLARTAADQQPVAVTGRYRPDPSGGFAGTLSTPSGISVSEVLRLRGPVAAAPLFQDLRTRVPLHSALPGWLKTIAFAAFRDYHRLPHIAPFVARRDFQDAIHMEVRDRTGFDWHRAHPNELLLLNKTVDEISLEEANIVRGAYGLKLFQKANNYDRDAVSRHMHSGMLAFGVRPDPNTPGGLLKSADMSSFLWTACYMWGQAKRYQATQDPQALATVTALANTFCDLIEIDPRPGEFARSLRPINAGPLGGRWHAGSGRFAHLQYYDNGNNDMIKGVWLAFMAAWDVLPQSSPVRARIQTAVREIADSWAAANPTAAGGTGHARNRPKSILLNNMLAFYLTGDARYEQVYKAQLRKPMLLLELAVGGTIAAYGIGDWSGTHLGLCTSMALVELGQRLSSPWLAVFKHHLRMNANRMRPYRGVLWSIAAAKYLNDASARDEVLWQLREFPYPKPKVAVDRTLDRTFCYDPIPSKPWKMDWMQGGRESSLYSYPVFMRNADNYTYRSGAFNRGSSRPTDMEHHGGDYLFAYWWARQTGIIPATE